MKLQRETPCDPPSDYNIGPCPRSVRLAITGWVAIMLAAYLFGCTIEVDVVNDEVVDDVSEACEMIFDGKFDEFKMWFDDYIKGKVAETLVGIGCVPDNEIDIGWDCSMICERTP